MSGTVVMVMVMIMIMMMMTAMSGVVVHVEVWLSPNLFGNTNDGGDNDDDDHHDKCNEDDDDPNDDDHNDDEPALGEDIEGWWRPRRLDKACSNTNWKQWWSNDDDDDDDVDKYYDNDDLGIVSGVPLVDVKAHSASCTEALAQVALQKQEIFEEKLILKKLFVVFEWCRMNKLKISLAHRPATLGAGKSATKKVELHPRPWFNRTAFWFFWDLPPVWWFVAAKADRYCHCLLWMKINFFGENWHSITMTFNFEYLIVINVQLAPRYHPPVVR